MNRNGLTTQEVEIRRAEHGSNRLTQIPPEPLWKKFLLGFKNPMILILVVALAVQVVLVALGEAVWFEPVFILIAIVLSNSITAVSEHKQEGRASALKEAESAREITKVVRDGRLQEIAGSDVVVGDVVYLQAGDKIPADGEMVEGAVRVDQAALNGETEEAEKRPLTDGERYEIKDLLNAHYAYRGTVVCGGEGYLEVKAVGDRTLFGELALEVQEDTRSTPLQVKLAGLAKQISTFGYIGAIAIFVTMIVRELMSVGAPADVLGWVHLLLGAITAAVTIVVCSVPEGLPMLTSILLSFQSIRMTKDNVLVRKINGLETAGSLSLLFSDKTGTITEGRLSVVEMATGNVKVFDALSKMPAALAHDVITGIGVNNSAVESDGAVLGGNSTDRALMNFLVSSHATEKMNKQAIHEFNPFDSTKKISTVTVDTEGGRVTYIKGAPERILDKCTRYVDENGAEKELVERGYLTAYIDGQAGRSMRLLAVARADGDTAESDLTLICVISIRDNVRKEAADAIRDVQAAGIQVVMITGDRKETAVAIAKEAGLLTSSEDVALTSAELGEKSDDELKELLPRLRVVARALPTDKSRLVRLAQELDMVVGMTGDGVNDSPALKKADVGFAMGSGTEVAKEAGDITILDDNFASIRKAILYGRTMFKSIRKFLVFQLTVNVAAVLICFLGPLVGVGSVLTVVQLLMINLVMDTLAAIAFCSEPPLDEYMAEKPVPRSEGIVTGRMFGQILLGAAVITAVCLGILLMPSLGAVVGGAPYLKSAVFATFMMAVAFHGFSARSNQINPFAGLKANPGFALVMLGVFVLQFVFVTFGGEMLSVRALSPQAWLWCLLLAFLVVPFDMIRKSFLKSRQKAL
ncbi:MAG: calcium-translocating P-type ATPase, PMCA-type [Clostridia bacterium]|nr:calcium-translocating P-type ATPase, PMCA-type [Clostridia bacterium]